MPTIRIKNNVYRKLFGPEDPIIFMPPVIDTFDREVDIHALLYTLRNMPVEKVIDVLFELPVEIIELYIINIDIDKDF